MVPVAHSPVLGALPSSLTFPRYHPPRHGSGGGYRDATARAAAGPRRLGRAGG